jgi:hypothetical protein
MTVLIVIAMAAGAGGFIWWAASAPQLRDRNAKGNGGGYVGIGDVGGSCDGGGDGGGGGCGGGE